MNDTPETESLLSKIKHLTKEAIAPYNTKPKAKPYVDQLRFLEHDLPEIPEIKNIFSKLVANVSNASGQVSEKERRLYIVERDLTYFVNELKRLEKNSTNLIPNSSFFN